MVLACESRNYDHSTCMQYQAANAGFTKYTAVNGEIALRNAICEDLLKRKGTKYAPEQIVVRDMCVFIMYFIESKYTCM